jgi:hypothetical protein
MRFIAWWLMLVASTAQAAEYRLVETAAEATARALADLGTLGGADQPHQRYVWLIDDTEQAAAGVQFAVHTAVSRSGIDVYPVKIGSLLRYDLRKLYPSDADYLDGHAAWEEFAVREPYWHVTTSKTVRVPDYVLDGETFNAKWVKTAELAPHGGGALLQLAAATGSALPIVRSDWFIAKSLTTLDGGHYYRFVGVKEKSDRDGFTPQEAYLLSRGVSESQCRDLFSDERSAINFSGVTGKARRIDVFRGVGVRPSRGTGLVAVTHDQANGQVDPKKDPLRNLVEFEDAGREVILERRSGFHEFTLWNAKGERVDSVPDTIATDNLIPAPHTKNLQSALSCIRCHGPDEGWKPFGNDVQKMVDRGLDIFDDVDSKEGTFATVQRLAGQYSGNLAEPLRLGRDSYSQAVFRVTKGSTVPVVSGIVSDVYQGYWLDRVTPQTACRELGFLVDEPDAELLLVRLLSRLPAAVDGVSPEDPILGLLKSGIPISRLQWELVYPDAAARAAVTLTELGQNKDQGNDAEMDRSTDAAAGIVDE